MAKIIGNTTATPNPRPDWAQTDETKADYINNKPSTLPNPNKLIFTGAVEGEYDGSQSVTLNIPVVSGEGGNDITHAWDGTILSVTSASGTSSADLKGDDGNGIARIEKTNTEDLVDTYTIAYTNGDTTEFTVTNGTSVTVSNVTESTKDGDNNVISFSDGKTINIKNGSSGHTPIKGTDYWTDEDKAEIVQSVIDALPDGDGVSY